MLISVMSGNGGMGKTTICACVSTFLAKQGKKTIVVDAKGVFSDLDIVLGVEGEFAYNLVDVLTKKCSLDDALHRVCENEELYFLPSSRNNDIFDFDTSELSNLLNELKNTFDYVIVECNNHKVSIKKLLPVSDMAIVVSCQDLLSVRNSDSVITMIEDEGVDIKLLINKFVSDETTTDYLMTPDDMIDRLGIKLIGVVPECDEFRKMINLSVFSLFENETVLKCVFENISKRIIGESIPLTDFNKKVKKSKFKVFSKK